MKHLLWIGVLLVALPAAAQTDMINTSLTNTDVATLYRGIPNTINIKGAGGNEALELISSNGKVTRPRSEKDIFWVKPSATTTDTLKLYQGEKLVVTKVFEVGKISRPVAQLGEITNKSATVKEIISNPTIKVVMPDCYYDHKSAVISFKTNLIEQAGDTLKTFEVSRGSQLSKQQIKEIKKLEKGDKVVLYHIKATCPDCVANLLDALTITIKEAE